MLAARRRVRKEFDEIEAEAERDLEAKRDLEAGHGVEAE